MRRGGVQGLHEQVKGGSELGKQKAVPGYSFIFNILWMYNKHKEMPRLVVTVLPTIILIIIVNSEGQEEMQRPGVQV